MDSDGIENEWLLSSDDVNAKHIHGLPMEYVESGIAPEDYLPVLALFLKWVTIIQGMLDAGDVSGLKFALGFFYTQLTPDIDMAHMLGDESMNVKGQIESLSDWLFNPECKHPKSNLQCEFFYEGTSYYKRDFSHLVYVLNAGFLGEWFGAGWIGDWEGPEDMDNDGVYENDGTHADANRKRLLDQLMNMVPFSNVQIRYPMIKNDYFDADESVDMTYLNGDLDLQITAVSEREDLKCEEPFSSSDAATPMCAKRRLGYYNAAPLTESNEGCTYPCNTSDRGKSYKDLYLEESAWVSSGAEFGDYDFPQFSSLNLYVDTGRLAENNCTSQFLDTSIEQSPTEMCYNLDYDMNVPDRENAYDDGTYGCVDTRYYFKSGATYRQYEAKDKQICGSDVYSMYAVPGRKSGNEGGECDDIGACNDKLVCFNPEIYPCPVSQSDDVTPSPSPTPTTLPSICIPQAHCVPNGRGIESLFRERHLSHIKGTNRLNYPNQPMLLYLEAQPWWDSILLRLGYRLLVTNSKVEWHTEGSTDGLLVDVDLLNVGYAAPVNSRTAYVTLDNADQAGDTPYEFATSWDVRDLQPSCALDELENVGTCDTGELPVSGVRWLIERSELVEIPTGCYNVGIWLPDRDERLRDRPEYAIRLAGRSTWRTNGINVIHTIGLPNADACAVESSGP